jgi:hypothetical protein
VGRHVDDDDAVRLLRRSAGDVAVPPAPVDRLVAEARRARLLRRVRIALLLGALLLLLLAFL